MDYSTLVERYSAERSQYAELARSVARHLGATLHAQNINHRCEHRAKDLGSLVKKAIAKARAYEDISDKAGVRAVLAAPRDRQKAVATIMSAFSIQKVEDKSRVLNADRFGYGGVHFDVKFADGPLQCEIQLHTPGESLWASSVHDLTYKTIAAPPADAMRLVYRARALTEVFDSELERAAEMLDSVIKTPAATVLRELEPRFFRIAERAYRPDMSLLILERIGAAVQGHAPTLADFCDEHEARMRNIYARYASSTNPCLTQPEAMAIFYLMDRDEHELRAAWSGLPVVWLQDMEAIWGVPSVVE